MASSTNVVSNTITKITERFNTVRVSYHETMPIIDNITRHLSTINGVTGKGHGDDDSLHIHRHDWITDIMDVLTNLWELLTNTTSLHPKQGTIATSFFSCFFSRTPRGLVLQLEQIEKSLENLAADSTKLCLKDRTKLRRSEERGNETKFQGRREDKEVIIGKILVSTKVNGIVSVAAIVGMQGMGKTTLAKFVCDDDRVKDNFVVIWVDAGIHGEFYADSVKKSMIQELDPEKETVAIDENLDLGAAIHGRRFFLVMDDLRSENREEWVKLYEMLKKAATSSGGAVLVTTRNSHVANVVDPNAWGLFRLRKEDSWSLFENLAGGNSSESKIRGVHQKLEKKCKGVPLALVTMARMLESKPIAELKQDHLEEEFMQEMKSIYFNDLPSLHQKQCFAYLSLVFPTHYFSVKAETLIQLWMAEGFLGHVNLNSPSLQHSQPEDLGLDCIQEFSRTSFLVLHDSKIMTYKIGNELIWELSRFVATKDRFCFCMDNRVETVKKTVSRVALSPSLNVTYGIPKFLINTNKTLHTLLFPMPYSYDWSSRIPYEVKLSWSACHELFLAFKCLRVLNLTDLGMKNLPDSIGELKSLRYLDLSHNNMKKLPKSIGKLKHLQTLILSHCHQLRKLPSEFQHLVNLRHLVMDECLQLEHVPLALKKLTSLLTLSHFTVSTRNNKSKHILGFRELVNLKNLSGELKISHLEQLKLKKSEQGLAYLKEKQHLKHLTLKWNHDDNDNHNNHDENDETSLGHLEPHVNLQGLDIVGYKGAKFSDWLLSLENLVTFSLYNCSWCKSLPPLDSFPKLKSLRFERLDSLEYINASQHELRLELLQELSIADCPKLKSWWQEGTEDTTAIFPSISNLKIRYCPKLECMPLYPNLDGNLLLEGSSMKPLMHTIDYSSSNMSLSSSSLPPLYKVQRLTITNVEGKEQSPLPDNWLERFISIHFLCISENLQRMRGFRHLTSLSTMIVTKCSRDDLPHDKQWQGLQSLRRLELQEVDKLKHFPEGVKHLTSLTKLSILSCSELTSLGEGIGELKSLEILLIKDCPKLGSLLGISKLESLKELSITDCRLLLPRCQRETGDDWPQIKHIRRIRLAGASEIYE
ncbi:putative disease resistance protein RGA1 isoform X1 [Arachis duranensis]|uniref:Disease resistance protein RGA1 isoform X1 n=1 Tax=Arachis duranensis TaxID=130453 RepID=A0A6P5NQI0_ARADU|nr:putative disease resistance protein RGA1 isoform X1 [Arachis duranensis]